MTSQFRRERSTTILVCLFGFRIKEINIFANWRNYRLHAVVLIIIVVVAGYFLLGRGEDLECESTAPPTALINLNDASDVEFCSLSEVGPAPLSVGNLAHDIREHAPFVSIAQYRHEVGKHVSEEQLAAYEEFFHVPVDYNGADAETLMQIAGVDEALAERLIAARPFADEAAFRAALVESGQLSEEQLSVVADYLVSE